MEKHGRYPFDLKKLLPLSLLILVIVIVYSNTFHAEWHLDDYENITINPNIHVKDISPESLCKTFYFQADNKISRPFARLTFGLNWYVGKDNVVGYHIVNTAVHVLTTFFLFLFILNLFNTYRLKDKYSEQSAYFIALLSAVLWATHPIQIQAVTYIVQRMASMAAMFYIMSMYFYLKGRLGSLPRKKTFFFIFAGISFGLGLATKENTATLPIAILLMEVIFFQNLKNPKILRRLVGISAIICGVVILSGSWMFLDSGFGAVFKNSGFRYFTPIQRLMTEARVLVFYLSEIYYPVPSRFAIEHDFAISTSLFKPWTTLPAIIFVILLNFFGAFQIKKRPLLSFGILFFFLNHLIESTVLSLEIIFEHRNYLPSLFSFLYISAVIRWMLDRYENKNKLIYTILTVFVIFMVISFGISTYVRNMDWKTEQSILEDAFQKAPRSARVLNNLAKVYYVKTGRADIAINMLQKALTLKKNNKRQEALILNGIGGIYYEKGNDKEAVPYLRKAVQQFPAYSSARYKLAGALAGIGKYTESKEHLDKIISKLPPNVNSPLNLNGLILAKEKKYKEAFYMFRKCLGIRNNDKNALLNIGALYFLTGEYSRAENFFKTAYHHHPEERFALLWLIETNLKLKDNRSVNRYINDLFLKVSAKGILALPQGLSGKYVFQRGIIAPPPNGLLIKEISKRLKI